MCKTQFVLGLVAWYVGLAHSWDYALSFGDKLIFYNSDGNKTDTVQFASHNVAGIVYDAVHNRILYVDKQSNDDAICGYYISSKENKCFVERSGRNIQSIAYDPATEKIFFTDSNEISINWLSLKRGSSKNVYGLIKMVNEIPTDIDVDSCRGYIYWCNRDYIERARLNGSGRTNIYYTSNKYFGLAIDQHSQNMYYIDSTNGYTFKSNSLDADNEFALSHLETSGKDITISKDYFYWLHSEDSYDSVWQYSMHVYPRYPNEISKFYTDKPLGIAANYKIEDQIKGIHNCNSLSSLLPINEAPSTTQRSDGSVCENYCLGGTCSVNEEGHPKCRCEAGYLGERCEISSCYNFCLHEGICSLNEEDEPVCKCDGNHEGSRCEADIKDTAPTLDLTKINITLADLLSSWRKPLSKMYLIVECK